MEERARRGEEGAGENSKRKRRRTFRDVHIVPIVASWLQENYIQDAEGSIAKEGIFNSYVQFCEDNNLTPSKNNIFSKMLKKIFPQIRSRRLGPRGKGVPHYGGISLRSPSSSPARPAASVSCATRRKRKIQPPSPGSSQEDSDDDYGDEDEEEEDVRDGRSDDEAEDDFDGEYDEGDDDYIGSASSPSPKRRVSSSTPDSGRYSTRSTRSSAFQDAFSSLSRMAEYEAEDQTSAPPSPLSFDITLPSTTSPFSVSSLSGETASHLPPAAQLEPQRTLSEGQSAIVMRLVQRFEETILLPHSTFTPKAESSDQPTEWDTFVEFSNLCEHAGLNALKSIFETVLNLRSAIQGNRVTPQSPSETRQQPQPLQSQEQQTLPSTTTTTPSSTASTLNNGVLGVKIAEDLTKLRDWLPSKQSLEAAFSMIRMESGPGPRLMRMWVLSLLAETQMHMGKESTAFRTAQLFMRTLEESIADPPLPIPPFGSGSMDFFEGIANVFYTTGNELYLIRLVSLLLHAKQFDNGLSNCVSTFTRKWNRVLYS